MSSLWSTDNKGKVTLIQCDDLGPQRWGPGGVG
jgi:hypothetical protein